MNPTVILHHYVEGRRPEDQKVTWDGLDLCRKHPYTTVIDVAAYSDTSWAEELEKLWDRGMSIVNVDMDIAIHPWHLDEFAKCQEQACTFAYSINFAYLPERQPVLVHRVREGTSERNLEVGEEWADFIGEGLMRIRPELQASIVPTPRVPQVSFRDQDWYLCERLGVQWHVHWPAVAHHHLWL